MKRKKTSNQVKKSEFNKATKIPALARSGEDNDVYTTSTKVLPIFLLQLIFASVYFSAFFVKPIASSTFFIRQRITNEWLTFGSGQKKNEGKQEKTQRRKFRILFTNIFIFILKSRDEK